MKQFSKYMTMVGFGLAILLSTILQPSPALAQGPGFNYQGELQDNGTPVNDTCDFQFSLFDAATNGTQIGATEDESNVTVSTGRFGVVLNDSQQFGAEPFNGEEQFLEIGVRCPTNTGDFTPLAPRQALLAVPYAHHVQHDHGGEQWTVDDIATGFSVTNTSDNAAAAIFGNVIDNDGVGVFGASSFPTGSGVGVRGESNGQTGIGVWGNATATSGEAIGVRGNSKATSGAGVKGIAESGTGVTKGVWGESQSAEGTGVLGSALANSGLNTGVMGLSLSPQGRGVFGLASTATGENRGVLGVSASNQGTGVYGWNSSTSNGISYGVYGQNDNPIGRAVYGLATHTSGQNFGIYGETKSNSGFAGYFQGRVHVQGQLSKSSGSFKIDHPLDPENMYLYHSFVESPDMMNIYNGNVELDKKGRAWVEMPEWFEALNQEFRYQLTPIGGPGPDLYIAQEIEGNRFQIAGGEPGMKVSWQVTGIRHDAYAEQNRIRVEEKKPAHLRGTYLNPAAFNQPVSKGENSYQPDGALGGGEDD